MSKNIVLLVMDTVRASALAPDTRKSIAPNVDQFADDGTAFSNAFASAPWTLPSHAGMFTGTYSSKHGANADHKRLDGQLITLAEAFSKADYETIAVSNNTWISEEFGFARGFEQFHKTWQYVQSETDLGEVARTKEGFEMLRSLGHRLIDGNPFVNIANAIYGKFLRKQDDDGARKTNKWIRNWLDTRDDGRPFFLFVNYLEPHLKYHPPKRYAEKYLPEGATYEEAMSVPQDAWNYIAGNTEITDREFELLRGLYHAEIAYLDRRIGELRDTLVKSGEWDNTVFVVTSDHGENIGEHGMMDHQYCLYDTLLHVPLVITGGAFEGGHTVEDLVQLTDIAPTLLDAADVSSPDFWNQVQGQSFHPDARSDSREYVVGEYVSPQPSMEALRKRVGELSDDMLKFDRSLRAIRTEEHKLVRGSDGTRERYRVAEDPHEEVELSETDPDWSEDLETELDAWTNSFEHAQTDSSVSMSNEAKDRLEELGYLQ